MVDWRLRMRRQAGVFAALATLLALLSLPQAARAQQVYVGSANGWDALIAHPEQWAFVRRHANGFYVNFIQMLHPDAKKCAQTSALFSHKNAYYESDSRNTGLGGFPDGGQFSRALQAQQLQALLDGGFRVPYTSLNYGVDDGKLADLKRQGLPAGVTRPCFAQNGPWTFGGDITKDIGDNARMRADTARTDGASTDGPMSLWQADQGQMRSGSYSLVKYAHTLHKTAAVMVTPYNLQPRSLWLAAAQGCVRQHEDAGAKPDIWIVFEYATDTPTLPEAVNGKPADTITGMAYWLIHHVQDPKHWAHLTSPVVDKAGTQTLTLRNDSAWMDLCPVLSAKVQDPHRDWNVRFSVNGKDVTRQMMQQGGLPFVGRLRLWPGDTRPVQVALTRRSLSAGSGRVLPPAVVLSLRPHPSAMGQINQRVTLRPIPERPAPLVAVRRYQEDKSAAMTTADAFALPLVIYVDVDDTFVRSYGTKRIPIPSVIGHIRALHEQGAVLYCWSSGGADYARESAAEFGLADCFMAFLPKPDVLLDDQNVADWRRRRQVHPNECRALVEAVKETKEVTP